MLQSHNGFLFAPPGSQPTILDRQVGILGICRRVGALALFARQVGRQQDGLNSQGLVAALMALANPNLLWYVGFQLSFMVTLGLVLYATPLTEAFVCLASRLFFPSKASIPHPPINQT